LTKAEFKTRATVWRTISEFYLDTELDNTAYNHIAATLLESKLNITELKDIDLYEVFPTLQVNLLGPAGEWAGFDAAWLHEQCKSNYAKRQSSKLFRISCRLKNKLYFWMRKKHWTELEKRMHSA